jgi:crotonobetainyl-CoA:carnitine CoA-transferase CaiB-like acyl-CoA transferase
MAKVGISIADISAGLYAYAAILTALLNRVRTGRGDRIDTSMLECLAEWMTPPLYVWLGTGKIPARVGVRHNMIVPYGAYACADGAVIFSVQNEREWRRFCDGVMGDAALADDERFLTNERRLTNRGELERMIERRFLGHARSEVTDWLERAGIAMGIVNDVAAVAAHPQLAARDRWTTVGSRAGAIPALVPPHNLRRAPPAMGAVPALGEHTAQILAELGEA